MYFKEEVPLDVVGTGGTIPGDLGDITKLPEILKEMKEFSKKRHLLTKTNKNRYFQS